MEIVQNWCEGEFETKYAELFAAGEIMRVPDEGFYLMIGGMFPINFNRIDWSIIEDRITMRTSDESLESDTLSFLNEVIQLHTSLKQEKIFLLGDAFDTGYEMNYETLLKVIHEFITYPQLCYVLFWPSKRCLNYIAFNNEMFFA